MHGQCRSTGELTIHRGLGNCVVTATAEASDDYEAGRRDLHRDGAGPGNLVLNLDDIADDNTVNIAEHQAGFAIKGDSGTEAGVDVSVQIGSETPLIDTSDQTTVTARRPGRWTCRPMPPTSPAAV